jgi:uncharacterized membrane protein YeaQ/YmgE (transglycosylase-associated protein family)
MKKEERQMGIVWAVIIGFFAGLIAKWVTPGRNKPSGFILTTVLGIVGSVLATWLGQAVGWYGPGDGAGGRSLAAGHNQKGRQWRPFVSRCRKL